MNYSDNDIDDFMSNQTPEPIPEPEETDEPEILTCDMCLEECDYNDCIIADGHIFCSDCTEDYTIVELIELIEKH